MATLVSSCSSLSHQFHLPSSDTGHIVNVLQGSILHWLQLLCIIEWLIQTAATCIGVWYPNVAISPQIFYYGISTKTNEKDIKIPKLQPPDWKSPCWMSLYNRKLVGVCSSKCDITTMRAAMWNPLQALSANNVFQVAALYLHLTWWNDSWYDLSRPYTMFLTSPSSNNYRVWRFCEPEQMSLHHGQRLTCCQARLEAMGK